MANGANGGLASNYVVSDAGQSVSANIDRLNSVAWIGGNTGNWFDPSNWAGGAVPDLANVANVTIPTGVNVSFNNSALLPAQSGTVSVENITSGGTLSLISGGLDVATSLRSTTLTQSGATLSGTGNVAVNNFNQTGGSVLSKGNFSVRESFTQSAPGNIAVGGNVDIAQNTGDLYIARLSGNNIDLTARNGGVGLGDVNAAGTLRIMAYGNINQTNDGTISANAGSTITSANGDITLANLGNNQDGTLIFSGRNITLSDKTGPTLELNASGDSRVMSGGSLVISGKTNNLTTTTLNGGNTSFGSITVAGNLTSLSAGAASKTGTVIVNGTASMTAAGEDAIANKSFVITLASTAPVTQTPPATLPDETTATAKPIDTVPPVVTTPPATVPPATTATAKPVDTASPVVTTPPATVPPATTATPKPIDTASPVATTPPTTVRPGTTALTLNDTSLADVPRVSTQGVNPTVSEIAENQSTTKISTENGMNVVTNEIDDGSRSLKVVAGGIAKSEREVDTKIPAIENTNTLAQSDL